MKTEIRAQGEISFRKVSKLPKGLMPHTEKDKIGRPIISHSENGHHHVLDRAVEVLEHPKPPAGMRILYALLNEPCGLIQDADDAHGRHELEPGIVEFRLAREYDPFLEQARQVAD